MKNHFQKLARATCVLILTLTVLAPAPVAAALPPANGGGQAAQGTAADHLRGGIGATGARGDAEGQITHVITAVVNLLSWIVGIVAVVMIIIGGLKYVTSSGDPSSTNAAKNTILFALVGLVVVALAQAIVIFVLNRAAP